MPGSSSSARWYAVRACSGSEASRSQAVSYQSAALGASSSETRRAPTSCSPRMSVTSSSGDDERDPVAEPPATIPRRPNPVASPARSAISLASKLSRNWPESALQRTRPSEATTSSPSVWMLMLVSGSSAARSEEHTSELQSHVNLVCRLLLEKKKDNRGCTVLTYCKSLSSG